MLVKCRSPGFGLTLVAETLNGSFLSAEMSSTPQGQGDPILPEDLGRNCAKLLLEEVHRVGAAKTLTYRTRSTHTHTHVRVFEVCRWRKYPWFQFLSRGSDLFWSLFVKFVCHFEHYNPPPINSIFNKDRLDIDLQCEVFIFQWKRASCCFGFREQVDKIKPVRICRHKALLHYCVWCLFQQLQYCRQL